MEYEFLPQFNLRYLTEVTEDQLDGYLYAQEQKQIKEVPLCGLGWIVVACAKQFRVNPIFILALMIHESRWGRSRLARVKNNLCGWGAYDKNPFKYAWKFHTKESCIITVCNSLDKKYLTQGGRFYKKAVPHGTIGGVGKVYASDKKWAEKVCKHMNQIGNFIDAKPFKPEAPGC